MLLGYSDKEPQSLGEQACPACVIPSEAIFWSTKPRWYAYVVYNSVGERYHANGKEEEMGLYKKRNNHEVIEKKIDFDRDLGSLTG